jgi:hypothetical protein
LSKSSTRRMAWLQATGSVGTAEGERILTEAGISQSASVPSEELSCFMLAVRHGSMYAEPLRAQRSRPELATPLGTKARKSFAQGTGYV